MTFEKILNMFVVLLVVIDPVGVTPVFGALTRGGGALYRRRMAFKGTALAAAILLVFAFIGDWLLTTLGITLPAFKIAGGILLFGVALDLMRAKRVETRATKAEADEAETREDVAVIPLGVPLLAGPGAVATVMVLVGRSQTLAERAVVFAAIAAVGAASLLVLRSAPLVARVLGTTGINIVGRVMGLILAAVATQFVIDGATGAFPHLLAGAR